MKYFYVFVCAALASLNFKSNCFPSRATENPCEGQPDGSYFTHPLGCKYFIVCRSGETITGSCPNGLAFSPFRPPCDLAANVDCFDDTTTTTMTLTTSTSTTSTTTTTSLPTTTPPTTTTPTTTTTPPTTTPPTTTPPTTTPPTTTSSTTTQSTTTPSTTTPSTTTTLTTTPSTTTRSTTTTSRPTTTTPPTTTQPPLTTNPPNNSIPPEIKCPEHDDPNEIVFLASNSQCSKYYICYHNKPVEMTCSRNLHWNIKTQKCDTIEKAQCTVSTMPSFFPVCPRDSVGTYPHPLNCEWFLYCYHGHMTVQQCPFFYNWDIESESCQLKTIAKCVLYSG